MNKGKSKLVKETPGKKQEDKKQEVKKEEVKKEEAKKKPEVKEVRDQTRVWSGLTVTQTCFLGFYGRIM